MWPFRRKVVLFYDNGSTRMQVVHTGRLGHMVMTGYRDDEWAKLETTGEVTGYMQGKVRWEPMSGWSDAELEQIGWRTPHRIKQET